MSNVKKNELCSFTSDGSGHDLTIIKRIIQDKFPKVKGKRNRTVIKMHRLIMNAKTNQNIDHIDGDGLNNQKSNLRFCTHLENMRNRKSNKGSSSKFVGVSKFISTKRNKLKNGSIKEYRYEYWMAQISGKYIGNFSTEKEAAIAFNKATLKRDKKFNKLNNINANTK